VANNGATDFKWKGRIVTKIAKLNDRPRTAIIYDDHGEVEVPLTACGGITVANVVAAGRNLGWEITPLPGAVPDTHIISRRDLEEGGDDDGPPLGLDSDV
jgi:hypothetical protein